MTIILIALGIVVGAISGGFMLLLGREIIKAEQERYRLSAARFKAERDAKAAT